MASRSARRVPGPGRDLLDEGREVVVLDSLGIGTRFLLDLEVVVRVEVLGLDGDLFVVPLPLDLCDADDDVGGEVAFCFVPVSGLAESQALEESSLYYTISVKGSMRVWK